MNVNIYNLKRFLTVAKKLVGRPSRPILTNCCIHAKGGLSMTNLEQSIEFGDCEGDPVAVVSIVNLEKIVKAQPKGAHDLSIEFDQSTGKVGIGFTKLLSENPEEYPPLPKHSHDDYSSRFSLPNDRMIESLKHALIWSAKEKSRFAFNGSQLSANRLVSTDGKRLLLTHLEGAVERTKGEGGSGIIPQIALKVWIDMLKQSTRAGTLVTMYDATLGDEATFQTDDMCLTTKLVIGSFPNVEAVIPKELPVSSTVRHSEMVDAIKLAKVTTSIENSSITLVVDNDNDTMRVQSKALDIGNSDIPVNAGMCGGELTLALNPDLLMDVLKLAEKGNPQVKLEMSRSNQPIKCCFEATKTSLAATAILMPVTTRNG